MRAIYTLTLDMVDASGPLRRSFYFSSDAERAEFLKQADFQGFRPRIVSKTLEKITTAREAVADMKQGQRSLLDAF